MRRVALAGLALAFAGGFYLVLVDTLSLPEVYVLVAVALLATAAFAISREEGFAEAAIRFRWLRRAHRPLARAPAEILILGQEAIAQLIKPRRSRGQLRAIPIRPEEGQHDLGRAALAESLGSFAPNTIVIGLDRRRGLLLAHQLRRRGGADQIDVLRIR